MIANVFHLRHRLDVKSKKTQNVAKRPNGRAAASADTNVPTQGRPLTYTLEKAAFVLQELAEGKSLRRICNSEIGMAFEPPLKPSTIRQWVVDDVEGFAAQYTRARDLGLDAMADEMFDIADDGANDLMTISKGDFSYEIENKEVTNRSKLRVELRKWYLSKLAPKRYGDRVEHTGPDGGAIVVRVVDDID